MVQKIFGTSGKVVGCIFDLRPIKLRAVSRELSDYTSFNIYQNTDEM